MAGYFSKERREQRRKDAEARRQDRERVRIARLKLRESKQAAALAGTRRQLAPLAAVGAPDKRPSRASYYADLAEANRRQAAVEAERGDWARADARTAQAEAAMRESHVVAERERMGMAASPVAAMRACRLTHSDPSHHVGPCSASCRAGNTVHYHRR